MIEHFFQCPYCWEKISVLLDPSVSDQQYIEDCGICCRPIEIRAVFQSQENLIFEAIDIEQ